MARVVLKLFITIKRKNLLLQWVDKMQLVKVPHPDLCPHKSFMQQLIGFQMGHSGKCGMSDNKAVYNYTKEGFVVTGGRQNVTSESTPLGTLTS